MILKNRSGLESLEKFGKVWKLVWKVWKSLEIGLESLEKFGKVAFFDDFQTFQTNFQTFPNFSKPTKII